MQKHDLETLRLSLVRAINALDAILYTKQDVVNARGLSLKEVQRWANAHLERCSIEDPPVSRKALLDDFNRWRNREATGARAFVPKLKLVLGGDVRHSAVHGGDRVVYGVKLKDV